MQKWHEIRYNKDSRAKSNQHFLFSMTCSVTMKKILLQLSFQGYWFYSEGHLEWIGVSVMLEPLKFSSVCLSIKQCIFRGRKKFVLFKTVRMSDILWWKYNRDGKIILVKIDEILRDLNSKKRKKIRIRKMQIVWEFLILKSTKLRPCVYRSLRNGKSVYCWPFPALSFFGHLFELHFQFKRLRVLG